MIRYALGASLAVAMCVSTAWAEDELKSGPQKPAMKIGAFNPLHCSGPREGEKDCLV
ncbi:MAG: hypothetical protein K2W96_00440 [Gemmataceae bacterium]|nr:hypothetical protein [Gemmataceae bacterium]